MLVKPFFILGDAEGARQAPATPGDRGASRRAVLIAGLTGLVGVAVGCGVAGMATANAGSAPVDSNVDPDLLGHLQALLGEPDALVYASSGVILLNAPKIPDDPMMVALVRRLAAATLREAAEGRGMTARLTAIGLQSVRRWGSLGKALEPHAAELAVLASTRGR